MSRWGTDVLALACIAGGALVGGVATMAMAAGGHDHDRHAVECVRVEDVGHTASVAVSVSGVGAETIVVAPRVRTHQAHCVTLEEFEWTGHEQRHLEVARVQMEAARQKLQAKRLELDGLELRLDASFEGMEEEITFEIQEALEQELQRLEVELIRLDEIGR